VKAARFTLSLAICAAICCAANGQDLRVGIYRLNPPSTLKIEATSGALTWRVCASCGQSTGESLDLDAVGSQIAFGQSGQSPELFLTGAYRMQAPHLEPISEQFPLHLTARDGRLQIVATLPLEDYVAMTLTAEGGEMAGDEAMKAMAVAVRTYAVRFRGRHSAEGYDLCDNTHCQVVSWTKPNARAVAAAAATKGLLVWYGGEVAETYYDQNCGGTTASAVEVWPGNDAPYLNSHADPYCVIPRPQTWESTIAIADIDAALRAAGLDVPHGWTSLEISARTGSRRAARLRLNGGFPSGAEIAASSFRFAVDRALGWNKIRSDLYSVRLEPDRVIFSGRGTGHGVGLCQAGAEEMAREGKDFRQILAFYYPGTDVGAHPSMAWQTRTNERFELRTLAPDKDSDILPIASRLLAEDEQTIGWKIQFTVQLQVFPTLDLYRDTTGEPGWVAASTRGGVIRLQPIAELRARKILDSTLQHELFHLLIESRAKPGLPIWFREGLALYFSDQAAAPETVTETAPAAMTDTQIESVLENSQDQAEMQRAYLAARVRVTGLIARYGKDAVLGWLSSGFPAWLGDSNGAGAEH